MYTVEEFDKAKTKVLKYILYKKRSESEVRKKFESVFNDEELLENVIEYLKQANYINDNEYIQKTINNFIALKNLSLKEIRYKLLAKGIKENQIEDYVYNNQEELEQYELKSAQNIANKKSDLDAEEIKKYLYKKGYKAESIKKALEE